MSWRLCWIPSNHFSWLYASSGKEKVEEWFDIILFWGGIWIYFQVGTIHFVMVISQWWPKGPPEATRGSRESPRISAHLSPIPPIFQILSRFFPISFNFLTRFFQDSFKILSRFFQDSSQILSIFLQDSRRFWNILNRFHQDSWGFLEDSWIFLKDSLKILGDSSKILRDSWRFSEDALTFFEDS